MPENQPNVNAEYNENLKKNHELDGALLSLYNKPETQEELQERVHILKEIPDRIDTPKVLIKLGDPAKADKYVYMQDDEGREYVIALPIDKAEYHREIANFARKLYGKDFNVIGGGYLSVRDGKLIVHGSSGSYGEAPKRVVSLVQEALPDIEVVDESPKEASNIEYKKTIDSIKDSVQSELYSVVFGDLAVRMGYDMTMMPKTADGAPDMAYMVYRSENGGSFGVDTLFAGLRKEDHSFVIKDLAITRWEMRDVSVKVEGDNVIAEFESSGEKNTLTFPLKELAQQKPYTDLNDAENNILGMYRDNQAIYKLPGTKNKTRHGLVS